MNQLKIVILGGGSAGWLTALFVRHIFPESEVTVIQNKEIGIVGVGEASTPSLVEFLQALKINPVDVVLKTSGVIKNGILFENWNGNGTSYFHGFQEKMEKFGIRHIFDFGCYDYYIKNLIDKKLDLSDYLYSSLLAKNNKVDLVNSSYSLHFDSNLLAKYLQEVGQTRNINVVEGLYKSVSTDDRGFIKSINLEDNKLDCDFVFDCSGFHRLLIGKHFKEPWISYNNHLPMKKAIPFWLEKQEDIEPFTRAIAMKYGWCWHIPLQHRVGAGYVFDSDYIDENQALEEAEKYFGRKLHINKIINFDAGRYRNIWVKNCLAVGLSSSFIEPLESTSLFATVVQLRVFLHYLNEILISDEKSLKSYNELISNNMDHILEFVYLHYISKRNDSIFWKEFREKNSVPDSLRDKMDQIENGTLRYLDLNAPNKTLHFTLQSYLQVAYGLDLIKKINVQFHERIHPTVEDYKANLDKFVQDSYKMSDLLSAANR